MLFGIFSFLNTGDVIFAAQVNRSVFKRIDTLFGIGSKIVKDDWSNETIPPAAVVKDNSANAVAILSANSSGSSNNKSSIIPAADSLTKEMVDQLAKKLSG